MPLITTEIAPGITVTRCTREPSVSRQRAWLYVHQERLCFYCGCEMTLDLTATRGFHCTVDHVQPRIRKGLNIWPNRVGACYTCNQDKHEMTGEEWLGSKAFKKLFWLRRIGTPNVNDPPPNWLVLEEKLRTRPIPDLNAWRAPRDLSPDLVR